MCDPVSIGVAAIGVSTVSGIAKHQGDKKAYEANKRIAQQDLALQYSDINARLQEESKLTSQAKGQVAEQAAALKGEATVQAAEGNVAGASVTALLNDLARQESNSQQTLDLNLELVRDQAERAKLGARAETIGRIAGVRAPSLLSTGLSIGASGLNIASGFIK